MKIAKYGISALVALCLLLPNVSLAATREELQQQVIALLVQRIQMLEAELASMKAASVSAKNTTTATTTKSNTKTEATKARCSDGLTYITGGNLKERRVHLCYSGIPGELPYFRTPTNQTCTVEKTDNGKARLRDCYADA